MKYGLWDVKGKCWIGNDDGPILHEDKVMSRIAASIASERMETAITSRHYLKLGDLVLKDVITPKISGGEAVLRIEARAKSK